MIAYLIWHLAGSSALAIVLNFLIELVILAIVFYLVRSNPMPEIHYVYMRLWNGILERVMVVRKK